MKKLIGLLIVIFIVSTGQVFATDCKVGEKRPNGGYVFFCDDPDNKVLPAGKVGLEAALRDKSSGVHWHNGTDIATGATTFAVGAGLLNTRKIISEQGAGNYAAILCYGLNATADENRDVDADWFLPSKDELALMYTNLKALTPSVGGFAPDWYWSSSEGNGNYAWFQGFGKIYDGGQNYFDKFYRNYVRCARAF